MLQRTYKLKHVITLPVMVSRINLTFLKKLKLMANANTQPVKMDVTMTFSALSTKILLASRLLGVRKQTIFSLQLRHAKIQMLLHPEDGADIETVFMVVVPIIEVSMVPTDAIITHMEEADTTGVDTEDLAMAVMETTITDIILADIIVATIQYGPVDPDMGTDMGTGMDHPMVPMVDLIYGRKYWRGR